MKIRNKELTFVASLDEVSVLRKFAILFLISSIIPMALLYYAYFGGHTIGIWAMILMVIGVLFGYLSIRSLLTQAFVIAKENRKLIEPYLSPETIKELDQGENELVVLSRTFRAITEKLESNINELKEKNDELQVLDQLKDDFVNNISHEFRLPLTIIQESIRQVDEGMFGEVNASQQKYFKMSLRNIDRLRALIDNMLDISKIEKGKLEINKKMINLVDPIKEVISDFSDKMKTKNLHFEFESPSESIMVHADRDKITQVILNLVGNGYKFTEKGRIKISIHDEKTFYKCSIEDSGIGIAPHELKQLFSKFHQIGRLKGKQDKGTGLGLVISKHIVELHDGQIIVDSKEGVGTTFSFTIPKT